MPWKRTDGRKRETSFNKQARPPSDPTEVSGRESAQRECGTGTHQLDEGVSALSDRTDRQPRRDDHFPRRQMMQHEPLDVQHDDGHGEEHSDPGAQVRPDEDRHAVREAVLREEEFAHGAPDRGGGDHGDDGEEPGRGHGFGGVLVLREHDEGDAERSQAGEACGPERGMRSCQSFPRASLKKVTTTFRLTDRDPVQDEGSIERLEPVLFSGCRDSRHDRDQPHGDGPEEERVGLVVQHGDKDSRREVVPQEGQEGEGAKEDHVADEEGAADRSERGVALEPGQPEQQNVDDSGALRALVCLVIIKHF